MSVVGMPVVGMSSNATKNASVLGGRMICPGMTRTLSSSKGKGKVVVINWLRPSRECGLSLL